MNDDRAKSPCRGPVICGFWGIFVGCLVSWWWCAEVSGASNLSSASRRAPSVTAAEATYNRLMQVPSYRALDEQMASVYNERRSRLGEPWKTEFKNQQIGWIRYRDAQLAAADPRAQVIIAENLTRARISELLALSGGGGQAVARQVPSAVVPPLSTATARPNDKPTQRVFTDWTSSALVGGETRINHPRALEHARETGRFGEVCDVLSDGMMTVTLRGEVGGTRDAFESRWVEDSRVGTVSYKVKRDDWYVVSGVKTGGTEYYLKVFLLNGGIYSVYATYPHAMNASYDPVVERMLKNFWPSFPKPLVSAAPFVPAPAPAPVPVSVEQGKVALLVANGKYRHLAGLENPRTDSERLASALKRAGFEVTVLLDGTKEEMIDSLALFEEKLSRTSGQGIGFFHYGGHAVQIEAKNYLIPVDATIPDEKRVSTRALDLDEVMGAMTGARAKASIVVLDACRDNPLPKVLTRSATRGLAPVAVKPRNSVIVYAADAGMRARDGVFTPILSRYIDRNDLSFTRLLTLVRKDVHAETDGAQTPAEYNQLFEEIFLAR